MCMGGGGNGWRGGSVESEGRIKKCTRSSLLVTYINFALDTTAWVTSINIMYT